MKEEKPRIHEILSRNILADKDAIVVDLERSQGSFLFDAETKRQYIDCFSQFASQPLGWNHPKLISRSGYLYNSSVHKVANSDMYTKEFCDFVQNFSSVTQDFKYHFYISGGTLAVENALKAAFDWKYQKSGIDANSLDVVHLKEAFHGRSGYTLSLTNNDYDDTKTRYYPKFKWTRISNHKIHFPIHEEEIKKLEEQSLSEAECALSKGNVAAIILEVVQGEGGDNHFRKEYLQGLRLLADKYETMLIFDEVQTGLGLTGEWWSYQHFGVKPDMICFGKKVQTCGFCSTERIDEVADNVFHIPSRINSTWGGNILDMSRSKLIIDIMKEDDLVNNAREVGAYFLEQLKNLPLENVRGRGLMVAFDLPDRNLRDAFMKKITENVLCLPCGKRSVRFRPHLDVSKDTINQVVEFVKNSI